MKKVLLILSILFILLTFGGAVYYFLHRDSANVGYATVPMVGALACISIYRWTSAKKE